MKMCAYRLILQTVFLLLLCLPSLAADETFFPASDEEQPPRYRLQQQPNHAVKRGITPSAAIDSRSYGKRYFKRQRSRTRTNSVQYVFKNEGALFELLEGGLSVSSAELPGTASITFENFVPPKGSKAVAQAVRLGSLSRDASEAKRVREVLYEQAYSGIDIAFSDSPNGLGLALTIRPGARISDIALAFEDIQHVKLLSSGAIHAVTEQGWLTLSAPRCVQERSGQAEAVACKFVAMGVRTLGLSVDGERVAGNRIGVQSELSVGPE